MSYNIPITNNSKPAGMAYVSSTVTNATGDGTNVVIIYDSVSAPGNDQGANFNTTTGILTIPVTGMYNFSVNVNLQNFSATGFSTGQLVCSSGKTYTLYSNNSSFSSTYCASINLLCTAGETYKFNVSVGGGSKQVNISGVNSGNPLNMFSWSLL